MAVYYTIEFPDYFADYAVEIEAKGYFADLAITFQGREIRPTFYDLDRFTQECEDAFESGRAYYAAPMLVVVRRVVREEIVATVEALAAGDFADLLGG
ncbi:MAG TPA: hypothetical protein VGM75_19600 [Pseudonocardiaceae bacterium]